MNTKSSFIKRIVLFYRPFWMIFAVLLTFFIATHLISTLSPYLLGKTVDAITNNEYKTSLLLVAAAFGISLFTNSILRWIREHYEINKLDSDIERYVATYSVKKLFGYSIGQHLNEHSGVKQSVANKGQNALNQLVMQVTYEILPTLIQVVVTLIILTVFDWRIALFCAFFVIAYIVISINRNKKSFAPVLDLRNKRQSQAKMQAELYHNVTLVISEAQESRMADEFDEKQGNVDNVVKKFWSKYLKPYYISRTLIFIGQFGSLALGVYFIHLGYHTTGSFITLFGWLGFIYNNLDNLMSTQRRLLFQLADIQKFFELLDVQPLIKETTAGIIPKNVSGKIEFKKVGFAYPSRKSTNENEDISTLDIEEKETEHTITSISFTIPAGSKAAFVGKSGSGKTTIVNLLRRYYDPQKGEILIDDINLKDIDLKWLRSQTGNVEQRVALFDQSIKDNILFGLNKDRETISDEKVIEVMREASLGDFLTKLKEHGIHTMIGENGIKLSGGEQQRIGIARALIKEPSILIFDEATSSLDVHNESLIHEAINRVAKGRTTIMIAHRLSTIKDADIIFVVDDGKIVGQGTHNELLKSSPEYQNLIKKQVF